MTVDDGDCDSVGDVEAETERVTVGDGVGDEEAETESVTVGVGVGDEEAETESVTDGVGVDEDEADTVAEGLPEGVADMDACARTPHAAAVTTRRRRRSADAIPILAPAEVHTSGCHFTVAKIPNADTTPTLGPYDL